MKSFKEFIEESDEHLTFGDTLGTHADIGTNMKDADFWVVRKGTNEKVGSVTDDYSPEHIGVKVRNHTIDPTYMKYALQHVHGTGYYSKLARGTTNLLNIKVGHVKSIPVQSSRFGNLFKKGKQIKESTEPDLHGDTHSVIDGLNRLKGKIDAGHSHVNVQTISSHELKPLSKKEIDQHESMASEARKKGDYFTGSMFGNEKGERFSVAHAIDSARKKPVTKMPLDHPFLRQQVNDHWQGNVERARNAANSDHPIIIMRH